MCLSALQIAFTLSSYIVITLLTPMLDVLEPSLYLSALGMLFDSPVMERFLDASFPTISSSM